MPVCVARLLQHVHVLVFLISHERPTGRMFRNTTKINEKNQVRTSKITQITKIFLLIFL